MRTTWYRHIFLLLLIVSLSLSTFSQTGPPGAPKKKKREHRVTVGWDVGRNQPKGDFAVASLSKFQKLQYVAPGKISGQDTNKMNGYAVTKYSFHWDIFLTYRITSHLSLIGMVSSDQNGFDIDMLYDQYTQYFPPNTTAITTGDNYIVTQFLGGLYYNIPIFPKNDLKKPDSPFLQQLQGKFSFEIKALAGTTSASYPGMSYFLGYNSVNGSYSNYTNITFPNGNGFGYYFGGGIKYAGAVEDWLAFGIHLNVNYMGSTVTYPYYDATYYSNNGFVSSSVNNPKTMAVSLLQYTIGVSLEF